MVQTEQAILRYSIIATLIVAAVAVIVGLLAHSFSIVFDGVYMLVDAAMSGLALLVARLIATTSASDAPRGTLLERFTFGFWHLEPIVLGLNGTLLIGACVYALINAIGSLLVGGRELQFSYAIAYTLFALVISVTMVLLERGANRTIRSDFIALDIQSWLMSAGIAGSLCVAFCIGYALEGSSYEWMSPYVDPVVLALICLALIPLPIATIRQALGEILLVTPVSLRDRVESIARDFVARYGFISHRAYVAKIGRGTQMEIYFIVPRGWPARRLEEWDSIRSEIGEEIGNEGPDRWLTVVFTADTRWAA
jgi:predicted Co/Zn/Cd cation transporter (cation efflux family)